MPAKLKRNLKSWMLVYVGFAVALIAANSGTAPQTQVIPVLTESHPAGITANKAYFLPSVDSSMRNDI